MVFLTAFMGFFATKVEISYQFAKLLPEDDQASKDYRYFKEKFGQDGTILLIGIEKDKLHELKNYKEWARLTNQIKGLPGIKNVASITNLKELVLVDSLEKFVFQKMKGLSPTNQDELDDLMYRLSEMPFYDGMFYNSETNSTVIAITFFEKDLNSKRRLDIVDQIKKRINYFNEVTEINSYASGLPFIRSTVMLKIRNEMGFFMGVAFIVTALLLFIFFRSVSPVVFSLLVIICGVITTLGTTVLFGFKLSVLSGLIPPLIIVIGVPNCILILNKYHTELANKKGKIHSLHIAMQRAGVSLFFANITTSIGFAVFCAVENELLYEFGLIASINVMVTYLFSMILVPIIFSYLPAPKSKHLHHLDAKRLRKVLDKVAVITANNRKVIYMVVSFICLISLYGLFQIRAFGYVVDDIPKTDRLITDMKYFEHSFGGVLPFEITIDTKRRNGLFAQNARVLYKINRAQKILKDYPELSKPLSIVEGIKYMYQVYRGGDKKYYRLPSVTDLKKIADYVKQEKGNSQLATFIDSTRQNTHISLLVADAGSTRINEITTSLKPRLDTIFNYDDEKKAWLPDSSQVDVRITGNSVVFLKGNDFLVENLIESVVLAIVLIMLFMFTLFTSFRMILISSIPSLVALLITAGLMGYADIYLKPSTILVFSIAFGISSDGTLYFLTKYRHEIRKNKLSIGDAVRLTISETGVSMIYTAIVLFFGFGMFTLSGFGGTQSLGILISFTLIIAYCTNLVLLPAFLLSLEKRLTNKSFVEDKGIIEDETNIVDED
ncbi:MAG: RND family transporter [Bacteroidia bacterium]